LHGGDRLDGVGAANDVCAGFRKPKVLHLAGLNQVLDGSSYVLDGHVRVNPVLIE
jgi:hypothetical protein